MFNIRVSIQNKTVSEQLNEIFQYIKANWRILSRSNKDLAQAAVDPKFETSSGRSLVYISARENFGRIENELRQALKPEDFSNLELRILPADIDDITEHGLLYLPHDYVVPGGRFNEMYGWDSYFILVGLLRDGEIELAKGMTDNLLYEIEHYGHILNANRTYYLTRSQPPFLSQMVVEVFRKNQDKTWLEKAVPFIEKTHKFWTNEPHLTAETGLSRYYSFGQGAAPEVVADEKDASGRTHYERVLEYYRNHEVNDYDVAQFYDRERDELTPLFYKGDHTMRESGFDPSNLFGQFNVDIINYNPVCLNSLIYQMEKDLAEIAHELGDEKASEKWTATARIRGVKIRELLWDENDGLFHQLNFNSKSFRRYPFLTTFYPLWVGIASKHQAKRVVENLGIFEKAGGLQTSNNKSGSQWDAPFGWSPLEMIAVEGLRRYGFDEEANRITVNFLSMIVEEFSKSGTIVEKYDVVKRKSETGGNIEFGYDYNVVGFGWTNGAFVRLYDALPDSAKFQITGNL